MASSSRYQLWAATPSVMVNVLVQANRVFSPAESDDDTESILSEDSEILDEVSQHGYQSFVDNLRSFSSTNVKSFSKKIVQSFGAVTRKRKYSSKRMEKFLSEINKEKQTRFSLKQLKKFTQNFSTQLGSGCYGNVYKGVLSNGTQVAVKYLQDNSSGEDHFMAEIRIVGRLYHRNIIRLIGFCYEANIKALVYDYMENAALDTFLFCNQQAVDWEKRYRIAIEMAKGFAYLHDDCPQMIIHYDIKPSNIVLDSEFSPKIADCGLAEIHDRGITHDTRIKGTYGYVAPELLMRGEGSSKCDVYSFGMVLFEIVSSRRNIRGTLPTMSQDWFPKHVWDEFEKGELDKLLVKHGIREKDTEQAKRMCMAALWCIQYIPENRPSMSTVVSILNGDKEAMIPPNPFVSSRHSYFTESPSSKNIPRADSQSFTSVIDEYETGMTSSSESSLRIC